MPRMSLPARPLAAVAVIAVAAAGLGAYFGIKGITAAHNGAGSAPGAAPSPRAGAGLAADAARGDAVLFGGLAAAADPPSPLGDTWTWDGSAWTQRHPAVSPPAAALNLMAYDPAGHDVLLVTTPGGGDVISSASPTRQPHTWVWDGTNWHEIGGSPPAVTGLSRMATDAATDSVILVTPAPPVPGPLVPCRTGPEPAEPLPAGCPSPVTTGRVSTWRWDGAGWHDMGSTSAADLGALSASFSGLVTDPVTGQAELFATRLAIATGCGASAPAPSGSGAMAGPCLGAPRGPALPAIVPDMTVRHWTGSGWSAARSVSPPDSGRSQGTVVADPADHRVVWVSEFDGTTWAFDGASWARLAGVLQPPLSQAAAAAAADGHPLVVGGLAMATGGRLGVSSQTWTWNGSAWQRHGGLLAPLAPVQATGLPGVVPPAGTGGAVTPAGTASATPS